MLVVIAVAGAVPVWLRGSDWLAVKWMAWPWWIAACAIPPVVLLAMTLGADARVPKLRISTIATLVTGPRGIRTYFRDAPAVLRGAAIFFAFGALARPENVLHDEQSGERGIDIVIVLDLSGSMRAIMDSPANEPLAQHGKRLTRLDTAKDVILDFISRRKTDRIGVVVFGRNAFVLAPPTLDYQLLHDARQARWSSTSSTATAPPSVTRSAPRVARLRRIDGEVEGHRPAHRRRLERRRALARVRDPPRARRRA